MVIKLARKMVYKLGFRPKHSSIFFSPSLHLMHVVIDARIMEWFEKGWSEAMEKAGDDATIVLPIIHYDQQDSQEINQEKVT